MTKYILNSGGLKNNPQKATKFFNEIVRGHGRNPKILLCFFAEKREDWEMKFEKYKKGFMELVSVDVSPNFELAFPDKFEKQVRNNDVVYIYGGDDELLMSRMKEFDLPTLWKDKTVAVISAGSDMLATHFWTCDWRKSMDGLGVLPIKVIPHYKSDYGKDDPRGSIDWKNALEELKEYGDTNLPIHALDEGDYLVIEK